MMNAINLGHAAAHSLVTNSEAKVIGLTSRGVFLSIDHRVLFVSFERWRGPLTINVDSALESALDCALGDRVQLSPARLIFPAIEVDLLAAQVWQPAAPPSTRPIPAQRETLKQLTSSVLARQTPEGFGPLLPHLLDLPEKQALSASNAALLARLIRLRESIHRRDFDQATELIESLLGLGRGLTPSGDDVTIGLLLTLNRWQADRNWRELKQRVIDLAHQRTTTISANLIECAANGEADERLSNVLDGLSTGTPSIEDCVNYVLDWGNSSGVDALVGITLAITA